jgi:hypothetical protein
LERCRQAKVANAPKTGAAAGTTLIGLLCMFYSPFSIACMTTGATVSRLMPRSLQYFDSSQMERLFWPLLALQPRQQRAIFSFVIILASLIMCSQLSAVLAEAFDELKSTPQ